MCLQYICHTPRFDAMLSGEFNFSYVHNHSIFSLNIVYYCTFGTFPPPDLPSSLSLSEMPRGGSCSLVAEGKHAQHRVRRHFTSILCYFNNFRSTTFPHIYIPVDFSIFGNFCHSWKFKHLLHSTIKIKTLKYPRRLRSSFPFEVNTFWYSHRRLQKLLSLWIWTAPRRYPYICKSSPLLFFHLLNQFLFL